LVGWLVGWPPTSPLAQCNQTHLWLLGWLVSILAGGAGSSSSCGKACGWYTTLRAVAGVALSHLCGGGCDAPGVAASASRLFGVWHRGDLMLGKLQAAVSGAAAYLGCGPIPVLWCCSTAVVQGHGVHSKHV
jgi:hypothetical protein